MKALAFGAHLDEFRVRIQKINKELEELGKSESIPELINSTNILRTNEFLTKSDSKKSELLKTYAEYLDQLENLLSAMFEIQTELKDIIKIQSSLIPGTKKNLSKTKKRSRKK